jgi:hypothetical protein
MLKAVLRWVLVLGSLLAIGPFAATLLANLRDADGGRAVTILVNGHLSQGLIAGLAVFAAAAVVGLAGSHFLSLNTGMWSAGLVLAWGAWAEGATDGGTLENIVRRAGGGKDLLTLAVEGLAVTLLGAALTWAMVKVAHRAQQPSAVDAKTGAAKAGAAAPALIYGEGDGKPMPALVGAFVVAAAGAGLVAWLFAVSGVKGQTVAAALLGAIAAGAAAQTAANAKGYHVTPVTPILGVALAALAGPVIAMTMHGAKLIDVVYSGNVFSLARPLSLDWAAGAILGVPIGLGWAGSMLDRRHHQ